MSCWVCLRNYKYMQNNFSKDKYRLFIDELGTPSPKDVFSDVYILSGCSVKKGESHDMKILADQIKFKYWGRTDIVFHSREIGKKENDFAIFKDKPEKFTEFINDLKNFLLTSNFKLFFVIVDKDKARKAGWEVMKIYKDTTAFLIRNFLLVLFINDLRGEIVIELGSAQKDITFIKAFSYFVGAGIPEAGIDISTAQRMFTAMSFVTKKNHDIEEQIADMFAHAAKIRYQGGIKGGKLGDFENMILSLLNSKLFFVPENPTRDRKKLYKLVEPFLCIP